MELLKFNNDKDEKIYSCAIHFLNNRAIIKFEDLPDDSLISKGFVLVNENNGVVQADYSEYAYVYALNEAEKTYTLTTDENDIYVEPEVPVQKELTEEEIAQQKEVEFTSTKEQKINEMNISCKNFIEKGVEYEGKNYSYTLQDQSNLLNAMNFASEIGMEFPYHADGESCSLYTYDELRAIHIQEELNVTKNQTYFNQLKLYINSFTSVDDIDTVKAIQYGDELTGDYLDKYNEIIEQSNKVAEAIK